jgi:hypothetical protein
MKTATLILDTLLYATLAAWLAGVVLLTMALTSAGSMWHD